jgi:colanic acid/amylovoran biosynthesis glycosyltransferase
MSGDPRTIVYVVSLFPCWSETFIVSEIDALLRRGADVRIVSLRPPFEKMVHPDAEALLGRVRWARGGLRGAGAALLELLHHPLVVVGALGVAVRALWRRPMELAKTLVSFYRALGLMSWLRRAAPRHVHAHWATYASSAAWLMARLAGTGFSFTTHAHDLFLHDHFIRRKIMDARFAVTISRYNLALIERRYGADAAARVRVVHCGVDPVEFDSFAGSGDPATLLSVGRLDAIKGFAVLIEACALLRQRGHVFRCAIIGEGGLRGELEGLIRGYALEDAVRLPGAQPQGQVRAAMAQAGIFVMPSVVTPAGDMDGIPVALMEAMAMRRPVVSTRVSGIPELIDDEDCGLLVESRDAAALAEAIGRLLADADLRQRLGARARQRIVEQFDADREGGRIHALVTGCRR